MVHCVQIISQTTPWILQFCLVTMHATQRTYSYSKEYSMDLQGWYQEWRNY